MGSVFSSWTVLGRGSALWRHTLETVTPRLRANSRCASCGHTLSEEPHLPFTTQRSDSHSQNWRTRRFSGRQAACHFVAFGCDQLSLDMSCFRLPWLLMQQPFERMCRVLPHCGESASPRADAGGVGYCAARVVDRAKFASRFVTRIAPPASAPPTSTRCSMRPRAA